MTTQLPLAATFAVFLVGATGIAVLVLNPAVLVRTWWARAATTTGFVTLAAVTVIDGIRGAAPDWHAATLAGGAVVLAAGGLLASTNRRARVLLATGALGIAAGTFELLPGPADVTHATVLAGALVAFAGIIIASRRSLATRVTAGAAASLLVLIVVLASAISAVIGSRLENERVHRLAERAGAEADRLDEEVARVADTAELVARSLRDGSSSEVAAALARYGPVVARHGITLRYLGADDGLLAGTNIAARTTAGVTTRGLDVLEGNLVAVGSTGISTATAPDRLIGAVVATKRIDSDFLNARATQPDTLAIALVADGRVLAAAGPVADRDVDVTARSARRRLGASGSVAVVVATPADVAAEARTEIERTLFLIALGAALLALLASAILGDRVGAAARRLTAAARAIQHGDLSVRTSLRGDDELGVMGGAFDSMASAIEGNAAELAEAAQREARIRAHLEAVVQGVGEAVVALDGEGRITDFNRAAERLTGLDADGVRGGLASEILHITADAGDDLSGRLREPTAGTGALEGELATPDGPVPVEVFSGPLAGAEGSVVLLRDVRREREVERMKTEFLNNIGHELKTPLTGVIGFAEFLKRQPPSYPHVDQCGDIFNAGQRLLRVVKALEFFAATGAGRTKMRPEVLDVRPIMEGAVARWASQLSSRHSISARVARNLPAVWADAKWLQMAVDALIDNAIKFSPKGGRISLTARAGEREGVVISVADEGVGLRTSDHRDLFEPFVQGDGSETREYGGLGLGLSIVRRIAEEHRGTVTCTARRRKGTAFSIFLPRGAADDRGTGNADAAAERQPADVV